MIDGMAPAVKIAGAIAMPLMTLGWVLPAERSCVSAVGGPGDAPESSTWRAFRAIAHTCIAYVHVDTGKLPSKQG